MVYVRGFPSTLLENEGEMSDNSRSVINIIAIYFSVLEAGMTLIAANLPSLWVIFSKVTLEKMLRCVRSIVSLGSNASSSKGSRKPRQRDSRGTLQALHSEVDLARPSESHHFESHAAYHLEIGTGISPLPLDDILVKDTILQTDERV